MFWGRLEVHRRHLPHWEGAGATYFVTWSLTRPQPPLMDRERDLVAEALSHFAEERYGLSAWVVMDDHVHVVVRPLHGWALSRILHSWKSYTAHQLVGTGGRSAPIWLEETYDRIVRDEVELARFVRYIAENPTRRWPGVVNYKWVWAQTGKDETPVLPNGPV